MKALLIGLFLSTLSAQATVIEGTFKATEVAPILVWENVNRTCYRYERSCQTVCSGGDGQGCGEECTTYDAPYECGGDEWVRRGSKPLLDLEVEYKIEFSNMTPGLNPVLRLNEKEIDKGFTKEDFVSKFFKLKNEGVYFYSVSIQINEILLSPSLKRLQVVVKANLIDPVKVNEIFETQTIVTDKKNLVLSSEIPLDAIELEVCVGQDRALTRNVRDLGCQKVSSRNVLLDKISFDQARGNRKLVYFFNWKMKGTHVNSTWHSSVFITN